MSNSVVSKMMKRILAFWGGLHLLAHFVTPGLAMALSRSTSDLYFKIGQRLGVRAQRRSPSVRSGMAGGGIDIAQAGAFFGTAVFAMCTLIRVRRRGVYRKSCGAKFIALDPCPVAKEPELPVWAADEPVCCEPESEAEPISPRSACSTHDTDPLVELTRSAVEWHADSDSDHEDLFARCLSEEVSTSRSPGCCTPGTQWLSEGRPEASALLLPPSCQVFRISSKDTLPHISG